MHTVTLNRPIDTPRWKLDAGQYLCEDLSAFELAIDAERGSTSVQPYAKSPAAAPHNELLISNGGYGDMLMWIPAFRRYRELYPFNRLTLSTRQRVHCVFSGLDFAPELIDYPVAFDDAVTKYDRIICSEHVQEASEEGKTTPAVDLKAKLLGVGPLEGEQRKTAYTVTETEKNYAAALMPRNHRKRIGIQLKSSSLTRDYHHTLMGQVMGALYDAGYEMLLFGSPNSCSEDSIPEMKRDLIKNMTLHGLTFRQSAALMQTCDVVFGPDSSASHVCGAIGIPAVIVFGSTGWQQRIADYQPHVTGITGHLPCSPCWHHPRGANYWPSGQPCATKGFCGAVNAIPPERIVAAIKKKLTTKPA